MFLRLKLALFIYALMIWSLNALPSPSCSNLAGLSTYIGQGCSTEECQAKQYPGPHCECRQCPPVPDESTSSFEAELYRCLVDVQGLCPKSEVILPKPKGTDSSETESKAHDTIDTELTHSNGLIKAGTKNATTTEHVDVFSNATSLTSKAAEEAPNKLLGLGIGIGLGTVVLVSAVAVAIVVGKKRLNKPRSGKGSEEEKAGLNTASGSVPGSTDEVNEAAEHPGCPQVTSSPTVTP